MGLDLVVYASIAALAYVAIKLLSPEAVGGDVSKQQKGPLDDSRTQPSVRGMINATSLGRNRVGAAVGYVGDRAVRTETST